MFSPYGSFQIVLSRPSNMSCSKLRHTVHADCKNCGKVKVDDQNATDWENLRIRELAKVNLLTKLFFGKGNQYYVEKRRG